MKPLTTLLITSVLLLAACTSSDIPIPNSRATTQPPVIITSTPQSDEMVILEQIDCAAETARDIELFRKIEPGTCFADICSIVGWPDRDVGSGIYIFVYDFDDGSQVTISFASYHIPVYSVVLEYPDGSQEILLDGDSLFRRSG
jgi:hypothetical protein